MATLQTRWLLSIILLYLPNCFSLADPPAPPSLPECFIPCDEESCSVHINCTWVWGQELHSPTNYSLHWVSANGGEEQVSRTSSGGSIPRDRFASHSELRVWVQATNQHGSSRSMAAVFNTADIFKPPPPKVTSAHQEPFEVNWNSFCDKLLSALERCDVRYRTDADQVWSEETVGFYGSYTFESPQSCSAYEFQVRCACGTSLMSDWSVTHRIPGMEASPVGELDVWRDCGISSFDCVLTWKTLPTSQACGLILGYEVRLSYSNGTEVLVNVSVAEPGGLLACDATRCHFTPSLKGASSASASAYSAHGATAPSLLALPGKEAKEQAFNLRMDEENLAVSWDEPPQLPDNMKEYVVQYKQAGRPPLQAFDWIKVDKRQRAESFKGHFEKYKPYQVSLFTVSQSSEVHRLASLIGYSLQRTPSRVHSIQVLSIAATHVTLLWEPVPLPKQGGLILYYQIGVEGQKVYNVSASPQDGTKAFQLLDLSPGQKYEVWIRAVTAAGPGEKATLTFETKNQEYFAYLVFGVVLIFVLALVSACCSKNKACPLGSTSFLDKVPDPHNSRIFRELKHQINDPVAWICIPVYEPHPKISLLEVVEIEPWASKSSRDKTSEAEGLTGPLGRRGNSQMDSQDDQMDAAVMEECHRRDHKYGKEAYSKMLDSDEEGEREDCWSSSEDEASSTGYETHFMPTASEILEVL